MISIDPGHGGKDPGAVSAGDQYEKYVAFTIAHKLYGLLDAMPQFQPVMTRDDDTFIALRERVLLAHQNKADMFVSIHADAAPNRSARGASVYVLSEHGASSAMARFLAESENSADRYDSLRDSALYSHDKRLSEVLVDMSMRTTKRYSQDLGKLLLSDLKRTSRIHQHRVDHAAFAVLKSPDIPSVLVETGFMSNRDDCRLLHTDHHQQALAESLTSGIKQYFDKYPLAYRAA
ncbi:N-acetylmuramoyl-L-alanine amidase [Oleiagrimonas sp. C23AA]|uniref:N-acetylmuramoyl-L-alanine amidase n=1 Tax=Oleiagrimonas sp. C23AA TaxID=2719047 RepID=UPI001421D2D3|nr:N-acetylmuramoyl-L-alanine amidase [Oleiagrimonas sp. C23AA]